MLLIQRIGFVALIACLATAALAADNPPNQNQAPAVGGGAPGDQPAVADPAAGLPDIPENQEEIEAVRNGEPTPTHPEKSAVPTPVDAAREARREAIDSVLSIRDAAIQALNDRLASTPAGPVSLEIQKEIENEKMAASRRLLELQLEFATRDGHEERINAVKAAIEAQDAPRPAPQPVDRPVPVNPGR